MSEPISVKGRILLKLSIAQGDIVEAYELAVKKNAMVSSVPVFKKLQDLQKELVTVMQEINKVQGLD